MFFRSFILFLALSPGPVTFAHRKLSNSYEKFLKSLEKYEIIYPKVLPYSPTRRPRSLTNTESPRRNVISINLSNFTIEARENEHSVLPRGFKGIRVTSARSQVTSEDDERLKKCIAVEGRIQDSPRSAAILTICKREIFGLIIIRGIPHFVQPIDGDRHVIYETKMAEGTGLMVDDIQTDMENELDGERANQRFTKPLISTAYEQSTDSRYTRNITAHGGHETYPKGNCTVHHCRPSRALTICDTGEKIKFTKDMAEVDYLEHIDPESKGPAYRYGGRKNAFNYRPPESYSHGDNNDDDDEEIATGQYKKLSKPYKRRESDTQMTSRWVKMAVGIDHDVIQFHGERTHQYIYTILNIVSTLFRNISNKVSLKIVVMTVIMYPDERDSPISGSDSRYPLFSVNRWNRGIWQNAKEKHDMAMWMTQKEFTNHVKTVPGAFMCRYQWQCILVEDAGWLSAIKIAHGIGHLVGLSHDGDLDHNNNCASEALLKTTIMSAEIPTVIPTPVWSTCSMEEFDTNIFKYQCLEKPPLHLEGSTIISGIFSLDEQCRIEFGDSWIFCSRILVPDPCKELWCNRVGGSRRSCMTRRTPTLEGTACGRGKRCINHTCEEAKRPPLEITSVTMLEEAEGENMPSIFDVVHTTAEHQETMTSAPGILIPHDLGDDLLPPLFPAARRPFYNGRR